MPITFRIDRTRRRVDTMVTGAVTFEDVRAHFDAMRLGQTITYTELIDATAVAAPALGPPEMWGIFELVTGWAPRERFGPRAVIVGDEISFGMVRMLGIIAAEHLPMKPFRDRRSAETWLSEIAGAPTG